MSCQRHGGGWCREGDKRAARWTAGDGEGVLGSRCVLGIGAIPCTTATTLSAFDRFDAINRLITLFPRQL